MRKKLSLYFYDLNDVTLGTSAIFFRSRWNSNEHQQGFLKTRGFPYPNYLGFGFSD